MKLQEGDVIRGRASHNKGIIRKITEVRATGYTWIYLDIPEMDFISENSNDPYFDLGWERVSGGIYAYDTEEQARKRDSAQSGKSNAQTEILGDS